MQTIPVDQTRFSSMVVISVGPDLDRDNKPRANRDGEPIWKLQVLFAPEKSGDFEPRATVEFVKIAGGPEPELHPMQEVEFTGLSGRHWSMEGRSGISLSADDVRPAKGLKVPNLKAD